MATVAKIAGVFPSLSVLCILAIVPSTLFARSITLNQALETALRNTGRGSIIDGNLDVAEQNYFAERINFYLPELSINGRLPAYSVNESYDFMPGTDVKILGRSKSLDFDADITLQQNLITGGSLTLKANLVDNDWEYPLLSTRTVDSVTVYSSRAVDENRSKGTFNFVFEQPILQPSEPKHQLRNKRDDLEIARCSRLEEAAALSKEVIEAYFGVLQSRLDVELGRDKLRSARLQAEIDSLKLIDGVVAEEDWLESMSARLDAELEFFEIEADAREQARTLASLLDYESTEPLEPVMPSTLDHPSSDDTDRLLGRWEDCLPIRKARYEYDKRQRAADFAAASHGLQGTLRADYGLERGNVEDNRLGDLRTEDLETDSWGLSLNLTYPLWDGGASGASVKAARLEAEQARLEYESAERTARAQIANLINQLNVSYRKLGVLEQQVSIARNKLDIARSRYEEGQISELTLLESKVSFQETQDKHLEEAKTYFSTRVDLESQYLD